MTDNQDKYLTTKMLLEHLKISRTTLWRLMNRAENHLPFVKIGGKLLFNSSDVQYWIDSSNGH